MTKVPATCCATAMQSLATTFESRYETWASAKSYVRRTLLGRGPMSSGRLVPFDVSVWTMSSCSMKPHCVELSPVISGTITERGRTFHWRRTRPSRDQFNRTESGTRCGGAASGRATPPLRTTSRLNSPKLDLAAADSGFDIYAEPRSSAHLLARRTGTTVGIQARMFRKDAYR